MIFDKFETVNAIENAMDSCKGESLDLMFDEVFHSDERYTNAHWSTRDLQEFVNFPDVDNTNLKQKGIQGAIDLIWAYEDPESNTTKDDLLALNPCIIEMQIDCIRVSNVLEDFFLELSNKHDYTYDSIIDDDMQSDFTKYAKKTRKEKVYNFMDQDLLFCKISHYHSKKLSRLYSLFFIWARKLAYPLRMVV